jgi:Kef-type K+ transport system membrane component KefB
VVQRSIMNKEMFELLRSQAASLQPLAKFALGMALVFGIPPLARRVRLPGVVGLLLGGVVIGPHVFGIFGEKGPILILWHSWDNGS